MGAHRLRYGVAERDTRLCPRRGLGVVGHVRGSRRRALVLEPRRADLPGADAPAPGRTPRYVTGHVFKPAVQRSWAHDQVAWSVDRLGRRFLAENSHRLVDGETNSLRFLDLAHLRLLLEVQLPHVAHVAALEDKRGPALRGEAGAGTAVGLDFGDHPPVMVGDDFGDALQGALDFPEGRAEITDFGVHRFRSN